MISRKRKILYCSVIVLAALIALLVVAEVVAAIIVGQRIQNSLAIFEGICTGRNCVAEITPRYDRPWKAREFSVTVRTNSKGYREDFEFNENDIDIAFMGDSFAFGHGVEVEERYSTVAAREHPKLKMASFSYSNGFQPEHYEYFLDRHPGLRPELLFVGLYLGNDLDSDLAETVIERSHDGTISRLSLPYRDVYRGTVINSPKYRYGWFSSLVESTNLGKLVAMQLNASPKWRERLETEQDVIPNSPNRLSTELGELDQHSLRAVKALIRIAQEMKKRGGVMHVLLIPQNFLVGEAKNPHLAPELIRSLDMIKTRNGLMQAVAERCIQNGLIKHDLSQILTIDDYFELDAHWNRRGHEKVGQYVSRIIDETIGAK